MKRCGVVLVLALCLSAGLRAEGVRDGFTVTLDVELARVTTNEALYSFGDLKVFLRQAGRVRSSRLRSARRADAIPAMPDRRHHGSGAGTDD